MILDFIANYVEKQKQKKLIIKSELERQKTNYVFRFLLMNYEKQLKGTVDYRLLFTLNVIWKKSRKWAN